MLPQLGTLYLPWAYDASQIAMVVAYMVHAVYLRPLDSNLPSLFGVDVAYGTVAVYGLLLGNLGGWTQRYISR